MTSAAVPVQTKQLTGALPAKVRVLITALAVASVVIIAVCVRAAIHNHEHVHVLWAAGAITAVVIGDIKLVELRIGHHGSSFTWAEAALILGVTLVGWNWFIPLGAATLLIRQLIARRAVVKSIFNAATFCTGATLARAGLWLFDGTRAAPNDHISIRDGFAWVGAALLFFLWVSLAVACVIAWSQHRPVVEVAKRGVRLKLVAFVGNAGAGLATVAISGANRSTIVILPFFFLLLYLAYNNVLRAQQEGETWRQLHAATLSLKRIDSRAVLRAVARGADTLFGSEVTEVVLDGDPHIGEVAVPRLLALGLEAQEVLRVDATSADAAASEELRQLGLRCVTLAPLESVGKRLGVLVIGFRGPVTLKRRERSVLSTFADQTSISLQHARLFEELSAERGRLDAIVQHASDGIMLIDGAGRVCSWNPALKMMTGRSQQVALGMPLGDALSASTENGLPLDGAQLIADVHEAEQLRVPVVLTTTDGRAREVVLAVSPVPDADGTSQFAVVVARDVTAQREVEQAKQDFIATVSHELRTPLTPIKGYLTLLLRPDFMPDKTKRDGLLTMMLEQTGQLERLVEDLLSVSRMQHGEFNIRLEDSDVLEVVRRAVRDFSSGSERPVDVRLPDEPAIAVCDPSRLQQVVGNLLSNAEKYSPAGLPVHVTVRVGAHEVELSVRDEGDGVPIDQREVVFEPFRRLGDTLTSTTRGTGLGLHIARQLIEAMSGRIWVDGAVGEGAVFHITAPLARPAVEESRDGATVITVDVARQSPVPSPTPVAPDQKRDEATVS